MSILTVLLYLIYAHSTVVDFYQDQSECLDTIPPLKNGQEPVGPSLCSQRFKTANTLNNFSSFRSDTPHFLRNNFKIFFPSMLVSRPHGRHL